MNTQLLETLEQFEGFTEAKHHKLLNDFIKLHIGALWRYDVRTTPWCAAMVNAVLVANGLAGSAVKNPKEALLAKSFLKEGKRVLTPEPGDIVVVQRGQGWQGHVGFYVGDFNAENIIVFGGNQYNPKTDRSDQVNKRVYPKYKVLGYRRIG